ncbi:DUF6798 domain-containing protein [Lyngbya confervoides]|uniref:DUF6798 domain-containing protein n=1 Tax=Lyngbya confervoides BDU141951 TaxID=1574623 RepID=A0ABD4T836_9CYAN|nr:DUF6798 domain-containing protein [Lyngbya confervoides]MCM1984689.1 hypothetical protein [Lyngbya confervoides BDU141951]
MMKSWIPLNPKQSASLAMGLFFTLAFLSFGGPSLIFNEGIYLLKSQQWANPGFLATDWYAGPASGQVHGLLFSIAIVPLWKIGLDAIAIALILRALETLLLAGVVLLILRHLQLPRTPAWLGLSLWVIAGQFGATGEWVIGGAEQKPFAYLSVLWGLYFALQSRWMAMAMALSLAVWLHILVGGWSALILFSVLLVQPGQIAPRAYGRAAALALLLVLPAVILSIQTLSQNEATGLGPLPPYQSLGQLMTLFRFPHHLDPTLFLPPKVLIRVGLITLGTYLALVLLPISKSAKTLFLGFSTGTLVLFGLGVGAFIQGHYAFLQLYPFRIADGFLPLFCYLFLPIALWVTLQYPLRRSLVQSSLLCVGVLISVGLLLAGVNDLPLRSILTLRPWAESLQLTPRNPKDQIMSWIRHNSPPESRFLVPPTWNNFLILAQRPAFVLTQAIPQNQQAWDWLYRLRLANNAQPFKQRGFAADQEVEANFRQLSPARLQCLAEQYQLQFYAVDRPRVDLQTQLVYQFGPYSLYNLQTLKINPSQSCDFQALSRTDLIPVPTLHVSAVQTVQTAPPLPYPPA